MKERGLAGSLPKRLVLLRGCASAVAADKGIQTGPDSKYFALYSELKKPFTNDGKELVLQFQVKHEQDLDCGGGYIKLLPGSRCARCCPASSCLPAPP